MKYIWQFGIIMTVTFIGEVLKYIIPLPIPASIYGLILMLFALKKNIIPIEEVKETGNFLIEIMPLMFIPAAAGLLVSWKALKDICIPVILSTILITVIVMVIAGKVTQFMIRTEKRSKS
ncbi:antiholin-like protein LrgA [Clostridium ragsdalei P11]|uniref:Antiholin-like protein LrgA n=1 Tax=Clostridium ragsdalei P11 TaxID=1353534 RepID=A0A1A6AWD2_9CLOT|nr:CidA/LrgA family protein [Clostridium ragsdalei]OBR94357.1 antiholin-like protein LrgA [Clostridium ragsdalei P11]